MSDVPAPILNFEHATIEAAPLYDAGMWDVHLSLAPGDVVLVRLERERMRLPLADAACGLLEPTDGRVTFGGVQWADRPPRECARQRAKIGRVFADGGWVSGLDLDENIMLAHRHHSGRPDKEIRDEAAGLARLLGLPGLPRISPARARRQDLRMAACVRAFLGEPDLLILESPTEGLYAEIMPGLMRALRAARQRGATVLWLTADPAVWNEPGVRPTCRCVMSGSQLLTCER
jgi:phospholipid/cholesterol/gamma-HCH transport system ATP-binding protein